MPYQPRKTKKNNNLPMLSYDFPMTSYESAPPPKRPRLNIQAAKRQSASLRPEDSFSFLFSAFVCSAFTFEGQQVPKTN